MPYELMCDVIVWYGLGMCEEEEEWDEEEKFFKSTHHNYSKPRQIVRGIKVYNKRK